VYDVLDWIELARGRVITVNKWYFFKGDEGLDRHQQNDMGLGGSVFGSRVWLLNPLSCVSFDMAISTRKKHPSSYRKQSFITVSPKSCHSTISLRFTLILSCHYIFHLVSFLQGFRRDVCARFSLMHATCPVHLTLLYLTILIW